MNTKYLYLLLNFLTIAVPLAFSFYPKAPFYKKWKHLWIAILVPAVIFLMWDEYFTQMGIWGFNEAYLTGWHIGSLPLEEILFFICIPYACVFTYEAFNYLIKKDYLGSSQKSITICIIAVSVMIGALNTDKWYTVTTFFGVAAYLTITLLFSKRPFLGRFYFSYVIILIPFFIVNGILTGSWIEGEVVWYNDSENLGMRMGTIPVEDAFYGMLLLVMNVSIFEWRQRQALH